MPTPPKPFAVINSEKKSHRTKAELNARKTAEKSLETGEKMRESKAVKLNSSAHAHFARIRKLLAGIGRDDAMHERVINRYCLMLAEAEQLEAEMLNTDVKRESIANERENGEMDAERFVELDTELVNQQIKLDAALQKKRKMLLDIEKENIMTIASGMRAIPKKAEEQEDDPMEALFNRRKA